MTFRDFFMGMAPPERATYAESACTTVGTLLQVAYGNKRVELGFADALVAVAAGRLALDDLPLTERAAQQRAIRERGQQQAAALARLDQVERPGPRAVA